MRKLLIILVMTAFVLSLMAAPATAAVLTVPVPYPTIQSAVNAAGPGDTVYVAAGTYYEHVMVNKPISLQGQDRNTTVIDGGGSGRVVSVSSTSNVSISGFTIQNSGSVGWPPDTGVFLYQAHYCSIANNILANNNNNGIYLQYSTNNTIEDCDVSHNQAFGVDIGDRSSSSNTIQNTNIHENGYAGISAYAGSHNTMISGCDICGNNWAGINMGWSGNWTIENSKICGNGSGISIDTAYYGTVRGNCICDNTYSGISLGGWGPYYNMIEGNTISSNQRGVSFDCMARYNTVTDNVILDNSQYGVYVSANSYANFGNSIYHNDFINNTTNAMDLRLWGTPNSWDNGYPSGGNYWSDYSGSDFNNDGIGDTPYVFTNAQDNYPLMNIRVSLQAMVDIDSDTLNLKDKVKGKRNWITVYIELPKCYDVADIDASTVRLGDTISPVLDTKYDFVTDPGEYLTDHDGDGILERMVKFDKSAVAGLLASEEGEVELEVTGNLANGIPFEGTDIIMVLK